MTAPAPKHILVVDDDPDFRVLQEMSLTAAGYTVTAAAGAAEARAWLARHTPDAAILDLMMEESDAGFVLSHEIKRRHPDLPVIIVTSVQRETDIEFDAATPEERAWIKADSLLSKPVRPEQITAALARLLKE
jgi:CheY-like chemotaxis protein